MYGVGIKHLPHFYGVRHHGYMPQYKTWDHWHSYKLLGKERVYHTWEEAWSFLLKTRFNGNETELYKHFQGLLPNYRVMKRQSIVNEERNK